MQWESQQENFQTGVAEAVNIYVNTHVLNHYVIKGQSNKAGSEVLLASSLTFWEVQIVKMPYLNKRDIKRTSSA